MLDGKIKDFKEIRYNLFMRWTWGYISQRYCSNCGCKSLPYEPKRHQTYQEQYSILNPTSNFYNHYRFVHIRSIFTLFVFIIGIENNTGVWVIQFNKIKILIVDKIDNLFRQNGHTHFNFREKKLLFRLGLETKP